MIRVYFKFNVIHIRNEINTTSVISIKIFGKKDYVKIKRIQARNVNVYRQNLESSLTF